MAKPKDEKPDPAAGKDAPKGGRAEPNEPGYATVNDTAEDGGAIRQTE